LRSAAIPLNKLVISKYCRCTDSVEESPSGKLHIHLAGQLCLVRIFSLLTNSVAVLAQWIKILLEKRMVTQMVKKFPRLSWDKKIQYHVNMFSPFVPVLRLTNPPRMFTPIPFRSVLINPSSLEALRPQFCMDSSSLPCVIHARSYNPS
jgi:hypothetical protein